MNSSAVVVRLLEGLFAPPGHELESLVATTYSLDPSVFLAILSATCLERSRLGDEGEFRDIAKEEWRTLLLDNLNRCVVFVDHHGPFDSGGRPLPPLAKTALDQVVKHMGRDKHLGGSLHSKLILAIFKDAKDRRQGRLYIGSKNLTLSRCVEFGAVYDLIPAMSSRNEAFSRNLLAYLEYLRKEEIRGASVNRIKPLASAIQAIKESRLQVSDPTLSFHWQSRFDRGAASPAPLHRSITPLLKGPWDGVFMHSPWARKSIVEVLANAMQPKTAICVKCLKEPRFSALDRPNVTYDLSPSAAGLPQQHQSHAKVYFFSRKKSSLLVYGSANLTSDGWGLSGTSNCRPNTEILISRRVDAAEYGYLTQIHGEPDDHVADAPEESAGDKAMSVLNSVDVQVEYSKATQSLVYELSRPFSSLPMKDVRVLHDLVEDRELDGQSEIDVFSGWPLPQRIEVPWLHAELHLVSSLVRISCPSLNVETHLVVDLPAAFYEGRRSLRTFRYSSSEIVQSLARLMEIPFAGASGDSGGADPLTKRLSLLLEGARVEQYAYRLARIRSTQPLAFIGTIKRVERLLNEIRENPQLSEHTDLGRLSNVLAHVHNELR